MTAIIPVIKLLNYLAFLFTLVVQIMRSVYQLQNILQLSLWNIFNNRTGKNSCGQGYWGNGTYKYQFYLRYMGFCKNLPGGRNKTHLRGRNQEWRQTPVHFIGCK